MSGLTDARAYVLRGLADGGWHPWSHFYSAAAPSTSLRGTRYGRNRRNLPWRATGARLADAGLIETDNSGSMRRVRITDAGRAALANAAERQED